MEFLNVERLQESEPLVANSSSANGRRHRCGKCNFTFASVIHFYRHKNFCSSSHDCWLCWPCCREFTCYSLLVKHQKKCVKTFQRRARNKKLLIKNLTLAKNILEAHQKSKLTLNESKESLKNNVLKPELNFSGKFTKQGPSTNNETKNVFDQQQFEFTQKKPSLENGNVQSLNIENPAKKTKFVKDDADSSQFGEACNCCKKLFKSKTLLEDHLIKNPMCFTTHKSTSGRVSSSASQSEQSSCKCCSRVFQSEHLLDKHLMRNPMCSKVHRLKNLKPTARKSLAGTNKRSDSDLSDEDYIKSPAKTAKKSFQSSQKFNRSDTYSCSICYTYFSSFSELESHKEKHYHKNESKQKGDSKCPQCDQVFEDSLRLFDHQQESNHWGKSTKSLTPTCYCPFCNKPFILVQSRNVHLSLHTETQFKEVRAFLKKTTCQQCSQAFATELDKLQHVRIHHEEKTESPPEIEIIDEISYDEDLNVSPVELESSSNADDILQSHKYVGYSNKKVMLTTTPAIREQLKKSPNVCPICNKRYSTSFIRNRHFRMHTLEHAFECPFCPTKFPRSERLTSHMQQEHNERLGYECKECGLRFITRMRALQHGNKVHPEYLANTLIKQRNATGNKKKHLTGNVNEVYIPDEEFYCEICELNFLKLCGLQRHRQSKLHQQMVEQHQMTKAKTQAKEIIPQPKEQIATFQLVANPVPSITSNPPSNSTMLQCLACTQEFSNVAEFVPHRMTHFSMENSNKVVNELNPYTCEICLKVLTSHQKIQIHLFWHMQNTQVEEANNNSIKIPKNLTGQPVARKSLGKVGSKVPALPRSGTVQQRSLFTCQFCCIGFTTKIQCSVHMEKFCLARNKIAATKDIAKSNQYSLSKNDSPQLKTTRPEKKLLPKSTKPIQDFLQKANKAIDFLHNASKNRQGPISKAGPDSGAGMQDDKTKCKNCSKEFENDNDFTEHEKTCAEVVKSIIYCQTCNCVFGISDLYDEHKVLFCNNTDFKPTMDIDSQKIGNLAISLQAMFNIACVSCNMVFESMQIMATHMNIHKVTSELAVVMNFNVGALPPVVTALPSDQPNVSALAKESQCVGIPGTPQPLDQAKESSNQPQGALEDQSSEMQPQEASEMQLKETENVQSGRQPQEVLEVLLSDQLQGASEVSPSEDTAMETDEKEPNNLMEMEEKPLLLREMSLRDISLDASELESNDLVILNETLNDNEELPTDVQDLGENPDVKPAKESNDVDAITGGQEMILNEDLIADDESLVSYEPIRLIDVLRHNFSSLFSVLVSDPEVLDRLGFGEKLIDDVLDSVLEQMGLSNIPNNESITELDRLRQNIRILLDVCIKDQVMDLIADGEPTTDAIVVAALKMFGAEVEEHHVELASDPIS